MRAVRVAHTITIREEPVESVQHPQGGAAKEHGVLEEPAAPQSQQGEFLQNLTQRVEGILARIVPHSSRRG